MSPRADVPDPGFSQGAVDLNKINEQLEQAMAQVAALTELVKQRDAKIAGLVAQLSEVLKRLYGRKSEKLDPGQLLMERLILEADKNLPEQAAESVSVPQTEVSGHTRRHRGRMRLAEHLERVNHYLDVEERKVCTSCGKELSCIGEEITERIDYRPSSLFVNRYIRPKYACGDCGCDGCGVKQHPAPEGPIDRCEADSGLLAHIIEEKYEHHSPLYRQEVKFTRQGIELSRKTMAGWMGRCAEVLKPLYERMREEILSYDIVLNDDTPVAMQEAGLGRTRTTRLWCTVGGEDLRYTMYNFTLSRSRDGPLGFFRDYKGHFVSDAYSGYAELFKSHGITHVGCWSHARRYFKKAQDVTPRSATEILVLIAKLYKIEAEAKDDTPEQRLRVRKKKSVAVLAQIETWLHNNRIQHLPQSPMSKAIEYTLGIWKNLNVYVTDGRLPIDNNLAENGIRPIALGRKNWLFMGSENGGHTAAILMSFCATCRKLKLNTWEYLQDVLQRINGHPMLRIDELLPHRWQKVRQQTA